MRWVDDLVAFNQLSVEEQQRVIGRTKADGIELSDSEKLRTAHIARVETTVESRKLEIFRRSVPYGADEYGLYFVAFSAERSRYDQMLERMFGNSSDGHRDRLTDFSKPVRCAYYFAPPVSGPVRSKGTLTWLSLVVQLIRVQPLPPTRLARTERSACGGCPRPEMTLAREATAAARPESADESISRACDRRVALV